MRRPFIGVRRDQGHRYLSITIVAFAVTVILVREYLDFAGYPRIGGGTLHVAHMLWGGLLLVVAAILIQLFVGRRALALSALAAGVGVGLFIDEVGKFITTSNDYFFAPARTDHLRRGPAVRAALGDRPARPAPHAGRSHPGRHRRHPGPR